MKFMHASALAAAAALLITGTLAAQEKKVQRSDLPAAVERTVAANSAGAEIRGFSREREKGHTYYEAEMMVAGLSKDMLIDATGAVVEIEEEVALDSLPVPVRMALAAKTGKGRITKVERLTKHGRMVAYEAQVTTAGKRSEVQVGPNGETLAHEE